ncbi:hypothetical protein OG900_12060 [Streptomyces sp. NBC_00433]
MPNPQQNHSGSGSDADGGGIDDPDAGKDFTNLDPTMAVGWNTPPSFNTDTGGSSGGTPATDVVPNSEPIAFDAATVRATENTLLAQARDAVWNYEALRQKVYAASHGAFWGPAHPDAPLAAMNTGSATPNTGYYQSMDDQDRADQDTLADIGDEFAPHINPAMQKALGMQSNALELLGAFIAMVNGSGQAYAHVDRSAHFPEPPGPVTS